MIFKNISKLLLLTFIFLISCKSFKVSEKFEKKIDSNEQIIEEYNLIDIEKNILINKNFDDYYSGIHNISWNSDKKISKLKTIDSSAKDYQESKPLKNIFYNDMLINLDYKSDVNIYALHNLEFIKSIKLKINLNNDNSYPTSFARINDIFYIAYSNGILLSFNLDGNIFWKKEFEDILKTPIKIYNQNIILMFGDKILSIDPISSNINWEYLYKGNQTFQSSGGDIATFNNLLFFILPNNVAGEIDTIFGEKYDSVFSDIIFDNTYNSKIDKIHSYKNILSYLDDKKFLTSINIINNDVVLNKAHIQNVNSFIFFRNSILTLHDNRILKASNIINNNLFWNTDISEFLKEKDSIIHATNYLNSIIIFSQNGKILEVDSKTGIVISSKNLKINNAKSIYFNQNKIIFSQDNGKTSFFIQ